MPFVFEDIHDQSVPTDSVSGGILEALFSTRQEAQARKRDRQVTEALRALAEIKALNDAYPTAKRTRMIQELERRYRENGLGGLE